MGLEPTGMCLPISNKLDSALSGPRPDTGTQGLSSVYIYIKKEWYIRCLFVLKNPYRGNEQHIVLMQEMPVDAMIQNL